MGNEVQGCSFGKLLSTHCILGIFRCSLYLYINIWQMPLYTANSIYLNLRLRSWLRELFFLSKPVYSGVVQHLKRANTLPFIIYDSDSTSMPIGLWDSGVSTCYIVQNLRGSRRSYGNFKSTFVCIVKIHTNSLRHTESQLGCVSSLFSWYVNCNLCSCN